MGSTVKPVTGSSRRRDFLIVDQASEAGPIIKLGTDIPREIDTLLAQLRQQREDEKYNRVWLAQQLNVKSSVLNQVLQPSAPAGSESNLAKRALSFLRRQNVKVKTDT